MSILKIQSNVSPYRGLPTDDTGSSSSVTGQTGETIQMYYNSSGTLTADAGQAAGTVVMAKTTYNNILNTLGDSLAKKGDTSISFTSTALTTEVGIGTVDPQFVESLDEASWSVRMAAIGAKLANGEYYIDYFKGVIYGKKTSTQSTLTSGAYKYQASATGGAVSGDITKVGSVAVPTAGADAVSNTRSDIPTSARISGFNGTTWDRIKAGITTATATLTGLLNTLPWAVYNATAPTKTDGQGNPLQSDSLGNLQVNSYTKLAGEDLTNDVMKVQRQATYTNISASALIKTGAGQLMGIMVNSAAAGATIKIWDQTSAAVPVLINTLTFTLAATQGGFFLPLPDIKFSTGLYVTIAVAAMDCTILWN